ncbi:MAG TPA: SGNH/GDSL hydrolase family protein [Pseudonocardiaceae bacterium]|nr:SGNH/GDSL hydrolase family protein [Pseudonocardiaceae bacterium]
MGKVGTWVALLTSMVGAVVSAAPVASAEPPLTLTGYVALGDSYSSGFGTGVYDVSSLRCFRSPLGYPPLWAGEHHPASFRFAACAGAMTADVLATQISALRPSTGLVTITIGGNDAGFGPVMRTCTLALSDHACFEAVDAAESFTQTVVRDRLAGAYAAIRANAPHARVIVLDYPRLFDLAPGCADPLVPNLARRRKLNEGADVLDDVIHSVSQRPGFRFTEVRGRFTGHGVCSAEPWINGPSLPPLAGAYHPNQIGYREGYLLALDALTQRSIAAD